MNRLFGTQLVNVLIMFFFVSIRVPTTSDPAVVGILNLDSSTTIVNLASIAGVPQTMKVVASGVNCALNKK